VRLLQFDIASLVTSNLIFFKFCYVLSICVTCKIICFQSRNYTGGRGAEGKAPLLAAIFSTLLKFSELLFYLIYFYSPSSKRTFASPPLKIFLPYHGITSSCGAVHFVKRSNSCLLKYFFHKLLCDKIKNWDSNT